VFEEAVQKTIAQDDNKTSAAQNNTSMAEHKHASHEIEIEDARKAGDHS